MALSFKKLAATFAAEVSNVDCRRPLVETEVLALESAMDFFSVLVFRDQALSDSEQLRFARQFGDIEGGGYGTGRIHFRTEDEERRLAEGVGDFSNIDGSGRPLTSQSRAYQFKLADRLWHSDSSFKAVPARYSMLSARAIPSWGGNTEFADMRAAWDALDERWRREIEGLVCLHSQKYSREKIGFTELSPAERIAFTPVRQRLVRTHPVTGRQSLFLSSHAGEIEGMSLPEARLLLHELTEFATQPQFVYSHAWRKNDLVVWDNRTTLHRGRRFDPAEKRDMRQTRLAGDSPTIEQQASQS